MKSAYELAMSRLEQAQPIISLTVEQKKALAEIDSEYNAGIAERRIFLDAEITKASGFEETIWDLKRQLASEIAVLEEKRELKKEKIRSGENA